MALNKKSYFQGGGSVNEPTPKKKKYPSETAIVVQPRFIEPFYRNYDLYETEGVDGPPKHGPGAGFYQNLHKYKSVSDFVEQKRLRNSNKYKAQDDYIVDTDANRRERVNKMKIRTSLLSSLLIKTAIDFPVDESIDESKLSGETGPILGDNGIKDLVPFGGMQSSLLPVPDPAGKQVSTLNFSNNLEDTENENVAPVDLDEEIERIMNKYVKPAEPSTYGLPSGISQEEKDLDVPSSAHPWGGIMENRNNTYEMFSF